MASGARAPPPVVAAGPATLKSRLPVLFALVAVIGLQLAIPKSYAVVPRWPLIALELLLLAVLTWLNPAAAHQCHATRPIRHLGAARRHHPRQHAVGGAAGHPNPVRVRSATRPRCCWAAARRSSSPTSSCSASGTGNWDRGGPFARRAGEQAPTRTSCSRQMDPDHRQTRSNRGWRPTFVDYLYVSLTNAMAFLAHRHHARWRAGRREMMAVQSLVAVTTIRARNRKGR